MFSSKKMKSERKTSPSLQGNKSKKERKMNNNSNTVSKSEEMLKTQYKLLHPFYSLYHHPPENPDPNSKNFMENAWDNYQYRYE
tara:strand:- start:872 stop:1123 length:252 start_codon:yes stop_codon:yes gene_type:complete